MDACTSPWHGRRVLVTGCTGFLGHAVTRELLDRGAIVAGLVRDTSGCVDFTRERDAGQFRAIRGRIEDRGRLHSAMAIHEASVVFHLASANPLGHNQGTDEVREAAALYHTRVPVIIARPAGQLRLMADEEPLPAPPLGTARFGELFGGGDRKLSRVVPRTVTALLNGESTTSTDSRTRDFVFVRDAARACLALAEAVGTRGESLDCVFRSGCERSDQEMTKLVADLFAGKSPVDVEAETASNPFGWRPSLPLGGALAETIAWYREFMRTRFAGPRTAAHRRVA